MGEVSPPEGGDTSTIMKTVGQSYHVYNRGAHKAPLFHDKIDYERFIGLMFVCNDSRTLKHHWYVDNFWNTENRDKLVSIFCYCLMPNHFHIGIHEIRENGIRDFLRKLMTAYAMYFNKKYDHSGTIVQGAFKAKLITEDKYLMYLIDYIHLNPYGIEEPDLTRFAKLENRAQADKVSKKYEYSSYKDYLGEIRQQNIIIDKVEVWPPIGGHTSINETTTPRGCGGIR